MKLDRKALAIIRDLKDDGKQQSEIAEHLAKLGYTQRLGAPVGRAAISIFCVKHGLRFRGSEEVSKHPAKVSRNLLKDVEELITSNINDNLKERMLRELLK